MATNAGAPVDLAAAERKLQNVSRRHERHRRQRTVVAGELLVIAVVGAAWELASTQSRLVPSVEATVLKLVEGIFTNGRFRYPLWVSMQVILEGFGIAAAAAVVTGLLLGRSRFWGAVIEPILMTFYVIPRIILYPVLLGFFGVTLTSERWMAFLSAFFPMAINAIAGVRDVNPTLTKLGRSYSCSRLQMARKILLPSAAPALMVGLRIGWSSAFVIVILAELFASQGGIGLLLIQSYNLLQYETMFALVALVCVLALVGNFALGTLERQVRAVAE